MHCFIDDSHHDALGFIVLAFVFAPTDLDAEVRAALAAAGLDPERQEFKSSARMDADPAMQEARQNIVRTLPEETKVAIAVCRRDHTVPLGKQCLQALQSILIRSGLSPDGLIVHVDQAIFHHRAQAQTQHAFFSFLAPVVLMPTEDSLKCRGIQVADLMAHSFAQVVREGVTDKPKLIGVGGPDTGYADGDTMSLSEVVLNHLRYKILVRGIVEAGQPFDPATDPVVLGPDEDPTSYGMYPEAIGWGVQIAQQQSDKVRRAVGRMLDRIWLGCGH